MHDVPALLFPYILASVGKVSAFRFDLTFKRPYYQLALGRMHLKSRGKRLRVPALNPKP